MSILVNDFSQYTAGIAPPDWTRRWAGSGNWIVTAAAGKDGVKNALKSGTIPGGTRNATSWNPLDALPGRDKVNILARVKSSIAANQDFQFVVRGSGAAATETGYRGGVANNTRRTDRYDAGVAYTWPNTNTLTGGSFAAETWYLLRYAVDGGVFSVKHWLDDGIATEPGSPQFSVTDTAPNLVSGWIGIFQSVLNGQTTWDQIAFATNGDIATFTPANDVIVIDSLGLTDPGTSVDSTHNLGIPDKLGMTDAVVSDLVSQFNLVITDRLGATDSRTVGGSFTTNVTIVEAIDLSDDTIVNQLVPGDIPIDPGTGTDPNAVIQGTAIFEDLTAKGFRTGSIMDRERARLLDKTGADPTGVTLQDLYFLANERPRL